MLYPIFDVLYRSADQSYESHGDVNSTGHVLGNVAVDAQQDMVGLDASLHWDSPVSNVHWIYQRLNQAFPLAEIQVQDTRGDDQHLAVIIASSAFAEKSRIACHQLVYGALDHMRQGKIHAMSLKTLIKP